MLTLYRTGRYETLGDVSPFVYRLETWLRMADIEFESKFGSTLQLLQEAPRGLIPFVDLDGERLDDSSVIIETLKGRHGDILNDERLTAKERALGTLVKTLCEHELFYFMIYGRWVDGDADTFAEFLYRATPDDERPMAKAAAKENVINGMLHGFRIGRYDPGFIRDAFRDRQNALAHFLGDKPFIFGEAPSTIDAGLYAILASFIHFPLPNPHVEIARDYQSLVAYCDRIKARYYPASDWQHGA